MKLFKYYWPKKSSFELRNFKSNIEKLTKIIEPQACHQISKPIFKKITFFINF